MQTYAGLFYVQSSLPSAAFTLKSVKVRSGIGAKTSRNILLRGVFMFLTFGLPFCPHNRSTGPIKDQSLSLCVYVFWSFDGVRVCMSVSFAYVCMMRRGGEDPTICTAEVKGGLFQRLMLTADSGALIRNLL